jgi:hypothetical protein
MKEIYQLNFLGGRLRQHTCPVNRLSTAVISCCSCVKFLGLGNVHEQPVQEKQSFSIDMSPLEPGLICQTRMRSFFGASPGMNWRCLHQLLGNRNKFLARGGLGVFQALYVFSDVFLRIGFLRLKCSLWDSSQKDTYHLNCLSGRGESQTCSANSR